MNKVKANNVFVNVLTGLFNVSSERFSQSGLKKMGGGMVALNCAALFLVDRKNGFFADGNIFAFNNSAVVENYSVSSFGCIYNFKNGVFGFNETFVSNLSAAFAIEGADVKNKNSFLFACEEIFLFCTGDRGNDAAFAFKGRIAGEFGF